MSKVGETGVRPTSMQDATKLTLKVPIILLLVLLHVTCSASQPITSHGSNQPILRSPDDLNENSGYRPLGQRIRPRHVRTWMPHVEFKIRLRNRQQSKLFPVQEQEEQSIVPQEQEESVPTATPISLMAALERASLPELRNIKKHYQTRATSSDPEGREPAKSRRIYRMSSNSAGKVTLVQLPEQWHFKNCLFSPIQCVFKRAFSIERTA